MPRYTAPDKNNVNFELEETQASSDISNVDFDLGTTDPGTVTSASASTLTATASVSTVESGITQATVSTLTPTETTPIGEPENLTGTVDKVDVTLNWTDHSDIESHSFIYRDIDTGSVKADYTLVGASRAANDTWTDYGLSSQTTYYYRATNAIISKSDPSNESATNSGFVPDYLWESGLYEDLYWTSVGPNALDAHPNPNGQGFELLWQAPPEPNDGYLIYRATSPGDTLDDYTLVAASSGTSFIDKEPDPTLGPYYYRVAFFRIERESVLSNEEQVTTEANTKTDSGTLTQITSTPSTVSSFATGNGSGIAQIHSFSFQTDTEGVSNEANNTTPAVTTTQSVNAATSAGDAAQVQTATASPFTPATTSSAAEPATITSATVNTKDSRDAIETTKALTAINTLTGKVSTLTAEGTITRASDGGRITDATVTPEATASTGVASTAGITAASTTTSTSPSQGVSSGNPTGLYFGGIGSNDEVRVPHDSSLNITGDITVAVRGVFPRNLDVDRDFGDTGNTWRGVIQKNGAWDLFIEEGGNFTFSVQQAGGNRLRHFVGDGGLKYGQQFTVICTYDSSTGDIETFLNGTSLGVENGTADAISSTTTQVDIGNFGSEDLLAVLDHARVDAEKWSAEEVQEYTNGGRPQTGTERLELPFEEGSGTTAFDISGNNNDGTHNTTYVPFTPYASFDYTIPARDAIAGDGASITGATATSDDVNAQTLAADGGTTAVTATTQDTASTASAGDGGLTPATAVSSGTDAGTSAFEEGTLTDGISTVLGVNADTIAFAVTPLNIKWEDDWGGDWSEETAGDGIIPIIISPEVVDAEAVGEATALPEQVTVTPLTDNALTISETSGVQPIAVATRTSTDTASTSDTTIPTSILTTPLTSTELSIAADGATLTGAISSPQTTPSIGTVTDSGLSAATASSITATETSVAADPAALETAVVTTVGESTSSAADGATLTAATSTSETVNALTSAADESIVESASVSPIEAGVGITVKQSLQSIVVDTKDSRDAIETAKALTAINTLTGKVSTLTAEGTITRASDSGRITKAIATPQATASTGISSDTGITPVESSVFSTDGTSIAAEQPQLAQVAISSLTEDALTTAAELPELASITVDTFVDDEALATDAFIQPIDSTILSPHESIILTVPLTSMEASTFDTVDENTSSFDDTQPTPISANQLPIDEDTLAAEEPINTSITTSSLLADDLGISDDDATIVPITATSFDTASSGLASDGTVTLADVDTIASGDEFTSSDDPATLVTGEATPVIPDPFTSKVETPSLQVGVFQGIRHDADTSAADPASITASSVDTFQTPSVGLASDGTVTLAGMQTITSGDELTISFAGELQSVVANQVTPIGEFTLADELAIPQPIVANQATLDDTAIAGEVDAGTSSTATPLSVDAGTTATDSGLVSIEADEVPVLDERVAVEEGSITDATMDTRTAGERTGTDESGFASITATTVSVDTGLAADDASITSASVNTKDAVGSIDTARALVGVSTETARAGTLTAEGTITRASDPARRTKAIASDLTVESTSLSEAAGLSTGAFTIRTTDGTTSAEEPAGAAQASASPLTIDGASSATDDGITSADMAVLTADDSGVSAGEPSLAEITADIVAEPIDVTPSRSLASIETTVSDTDSTSLSTEDNVETDVTAAQVFIEEDSFAADEPTPSSMTASATTPDSTGIRNTKKSLEPTKIEVETSVANTLAFEEGTLQPIYATIIGTSTGVSLDEASLTDVIVEPRIGLIAQNDDGSLSFVTMETLSLDETQVIRGGLVTDALVSADVTVFDAEDYFLGAGVAPGSVTQQGHNLYKLLAQSTRAEKLTPEENDVALLSDSVNGAELIGNGHNNTERLHE